MSRADLTRAIFLFTLPILETTKDEVFVTAKRALAGVEFKNTGAEAFVSLRYFGPDVHKSVPKVGDHRKGR